MSDCTESEFNGDCCCNCINQVRIVCHPTNGNTKHYGFMEDRIKIGKGPITELLAWGCELLRKMGESEGHEDVIMYFDHKHGMCEMHQRKTI